MKILNPVPKHYKIKKKIISLCGNAIWARMKANYTEFPLYIRDYGENIWDPSTMNYPSLESLLDKINRNPIDIFTWSKTPEGVDFWRYINNCYNNNEKVEYKKLRILLKKYGKKNKSNQHPFDTLDMNVYPYGDQWNLF